MRLPSIVPLSGQSVESALSLLQQTVEVIGGISPRPTIGALLRPGAPRDGGVLATYQQVTTKAAERLSGTFAYDDVETLILTRRHWLLMSMVSASASVRTTAGLITAELSDRDRFLRNLITEYRAIQESWKSNTAAVLMPDTNIYLHHERRFDEIYWRALADGREVRLLVPIAVVRELDRQKRTGKQIQVSDTNKETVRTRARVTGRRLRDLFHDPDTVASLGKGNQIELLLDPLDHRAIEDTDTEIIERALAASRLIDKSIAMVTDDGGMQFNARSAGLELLPLRAGSANS